MSDHPVLIKTSQGVIGGIVTEPDDGRAEAALVFLQGGGVVREDVRGGAPGGVWAQLARRAAARGTVVLRIDRPGSGESFEADARPRRGEAAVSESVSWFRKGTGDLDFFIAGTCLGARVAICLAASQPDVAGLGLVVPHLGVVGDWRSQVHRLRMRAPWWLRRAIPAPMRLDRRVLADLESVASRTPVWGLRGARDRDHLPLITSPAARDAMTVEVVPDVALHNLGSMVARRETLDRVTRWVVRLREQRQLLGA